MTFTFLESLRYRRVLANRVIFRGSLPDTSILKFSEITIGGILIGLMVFFFTLAIEKLLYLNNVSNVPGLFGILTTSIIWLQPWIIVFLKSIRNHERLHLSLIHNFSFKQRLVANIALAFFLSLGLTYSFIFGSREHITPELHSGWMSVVYKEIIVTETNKQPFFILWILLTIGFTGIPYITQQQRYSKSKTIYKSHSLPFTLWLGESTGWFSDYLRETSIAPKQHLALSMHDACQNVLVLGAMDAEKTTRMIHPLLLQLFDQFAGGLIFDIKGDLQTAVHYCATQTKRSYTIVEPGLIRMNLIQGLTPELAASFLKSAFSLSDEFKAERSSWIDTATELCRNALGVLSFTPQHYNLQGLYRYLFESDFQKERMGNTELLVPLLDTKQQCLFEGYRQHQKGIFDQLDEKIKSDVLATLSEILSPFKNFDLANTFCTESEEIKEEKILEGAIYLINLPLSSFGPEAKVIYTLIKLRFFNVMQQRTLNVHWDQTRPVFFMCDEYQEFVSVNKEGLSDLNFWDKTYNSKTIGIISAQSISSFYEALGDFTLVQALLQNFRQKICFRTEDEMTITFFRQLLDNVVTSQVVTVDEDSFVYNPFHVIHTKKSIFNGQLFKEMETNKAVALLTINGHAADDVLKVEPSSCVTHHLPP